MRRTLTRRDFLRAAGAGVAGSALLGGAGYALGGGPETNVVLVVIDSLRKDHLGAYGNGWIRTPHLDALAKESLRFERAYPESLPTICARRAIHTGKRTWPFRDRPSEQESAPAYGWLPIPAGQTTLAEMLEAAGYQTVLVTDTYHQFRRPMDFSRGFKVYHWIRGQEKDRYRPPISASDREAREQYLLHGEANKARQYLANIRNRETEEDWFAPRVFLRATQLLEEAGKREPFFLVVDCYDPHEPWDPPEKYASLYGEPYEGPEPFTSLYGSDDYLTARQLRRMRGLYAGEVTMVDTWLGNFLGRMEELGLFENTLLVLLSDHGHALGEHGITGKPHYALWPELTDIVFMIRHPEGKGGGSSSDYFASTHDVAPTILGFLGVEPEQPMDGQDLSVLFAGKSPESRPHFTLGYSKFVWARDERYAMFCRNDGTEARLYDLSADPRMDSDVAGANHAVVKRMFDEYVLGDAGGPLPTY
ncbi:MAG: sulfatase [Actinomycetota bacterium]|nr:sulfatase [Actinomycetota bacterium]